MDAVKPPPPCPCPPSISPKLSQSETLPGIYNDVACSAEMSGSSGMTATKTTRMFTRQLETDLDVSLSGTDPDDSLSNCSVSDSQSQSDSPSTILLEPGLSLVAKSVVIVKSDFGPIKTHTYNFSIVNTTSEPIQLNYQPIMCQPFQPDCPKTYGTEVEPDPEILRTSDSGVQDHVYQPWGQVSTAESEHVKLIKTEPADYSITMNESMDTGSEGSYPLSDSLQNEEYEGDEDIHVASIHPAQEIQGHGLTDYNVSGKTLAFPQDIQSLGRGRKRKGSSPKKSSGLSSEARTISKVEHQPEEVQGVIVERWSSPTKRLIPRSSRLCAETGKAIKGTSWPNADCIITANEAGNQSREKLTSCHICPKEFDSIVQLQKHLQLHSDGKHFSCEHCNKSYKDRSSLNRHLRTVHVDGSHGGEKSPNSRAAKLESGSGTLCDHCGKSFHNPSALQTHLVVHSNERPFKCEGCGKFLKTKNDLRRHARLHANERRHKCADCPKAFNSAATLRCHRRIHTGERPYKCKFCDETFRQITARSEHINSKHTCERVYACKICGKTYLRSGSLYCHERTHLPQTGEKPFECTLCTKAFRTKELLTLHSRTHTGEKPCKCRYCELSFRTCSVRAIHERIHTGEKPYKCVHCGKAFRQKDPYRQHLNIHTGERPYKCKCCDKSFASKATLFNHRKMHKREGAEPKYEGDNRDVAPFSALEGVDSKSEGDIDGVTPFSALLEEQKSEEDVQGATPFSALEGEPTSEGVTPFSALYSS
ncbi:zinc finger protein 724-like [Lineus longissimus]|uniref:zinc finger protein 724-like n=1 Tax=Lineus longissimus TaxID=88925 RepID=UPI00315CF8A3